MALVGTEHIVIGDKVKEEERRAFAMRTRLAKKVDISIAVKTSTNEVLKFGMNKAQTISELKSKIQDKVGIPPDQQQLLFPSGKPVSDFEDASKFHMWQVAELNDNPNPVWTLSNEIEAETQARVIIEDGNHSMPPQPTTGFNLGLDKLTKDNLKEWGRLIGEKFVKSDKDKKVDAVARLQKYLEWAFSKDNL